MGTLARLFMMKQMGKGTGQNAVYIYRAFLIILFVVVFYLLFRKISTTVKKQTQRMRDEELEDKIGSVEEAYALRLRSAIFSVKYPWPVGWSQDEGELENVASELSGNKALFQKVNAFYYDKYGTNILDDLAKNGESEDVTDFTTELGFSNI